MKFEELKLGMILTFKHENLDNRYVILEKTSQLVNMLVVALNDKSVTIATNRKRTWGEYNKVFVENLRDISSDEDVRKKILESIFEFKRYFHEI
jgi:hypothetical protein